MLKLILVGLAIGLVVSLVAGVGEWLIGALGQGLPDDWRDLNR